MRNQRSGTRPLLVIPLLLLACTADLRSTPAPSEKSATDLSTTSGRRALLVGINDYSASRFISPPGATRGKTEIRTPKGTRASWPSLSGAVNDIEAMRAMLVGRYGFDDGDVLLLTDQEATRQAILRAVTEHLVKPARKDDVVVFYFSGHGSQVKNTESDEPDRLDESIVPADSKVGRPDVRDKELRRLFNQILDQRADLVVILDSCHSGSGARGQSRGLHPDLRDITDGDDYGPRPESRGALVLSAAEDDRLAYETMDEHGRAHGAFSLALLRALRSASATESAERVFQRAWSWLGERPRLQNPVLEGLPRRKREPLFGGAGGPPRGLVVPVDRVFKDSVTLQGGWVHGLAVGSELRRLEAPANRATRIRVTALQGLGRSKAVLISEAQIANVEVTPGQLFEIDTWVAPDQGTLKVWAPRTMSPTGDRLPAPDALLDKIEIGPGTRNSSAELTSDQNQAFYVLAGRRRKGAGEYAWELRDPVPADAWLGLPVRTAWHRLPTDPEPEETDAVAAALQDSVLRLSKIHAWHALTSWYRIDAPARAREAFPYRLAVVRADGESVGDGLLYSGRTYQIALELPHGSRPRAVERRFVYVFSIDSHGNSKLLYPPPYLELENLHPKPGGVAPARILLGADSAFDIVAPFGSDTFFLLATAERIPNAYAIFQYGGVRGKGPAAQTALAQLLAQTGSTTRGSRSLATPLNWSLDKKVFRSSDGKIRPL